MSVHDEVFLRYLFIQKTEKIYKTPIRLLNIDVLIDNMHKSS